MKFQFKKRLGQHILVDKKVLEKIVEAAELKKDDVILEIGPGTGVLTFELARRVKKVFAVEKDPWLAKDLESRIKNLGNIEIIPGDALEIISKSKFLISNQIPISNFKIVGNIPYYITGYLLRIIGELPQKPKLIVLTIQKEVAERIVAQPPKTNMLAVSVQIWAKPDIVSFVSKKSFQPQPKVDSAIIKLTPHLEAKLPSGVVALANAGFRQPRKLLISNLLKYGSLFLIKVDLLKIFQKLGFQPNIRAQDLTIDDWIRLNNML